MVVVDDVNNKLHGEEEDAAAKVTDKLQKKVVKRRKVASMTSCKRRW